MTSKHGDAPPTTTAHGERVYQPRRDPRRELALCLSGGGFRAALFHLGAVRRLHELGILRQVTTLTAASGGSTIAAHLANTWCLWKEGPEAFTAAAWERRIAAPFRRFTSYNLSTRPALKGWLPWNWSSNAGIDALAAACEKRMLCARTVHDLPDRPRFMFCATDLLSGSQWIFEKASDEPWKVATAVAVSSCFPGVFRPFTRSEPRHIALVDGGVDDDRAVEPVWQTHEFVLVSDGGDVLRPQWGESLWWSLIRSAQVVWNSMQVVQKRWLLANFMSGRMAGAYWGIDSAPLHYQPDEGPPYLGYTPALARDLIATIRTNYDAFSDAEAAVLENHGYLLAEAATLTHLAAKRNGAPLQIPHPAWMSESKIREALSDSSRQVFLGRGALQALLRQGPSVVPD
jgi:NTE family protein